MKKLLLLGAFAIVVTTAVFSVPGKVIADAACYGPNTLLANWPGATAPAGGITYPLCNSSGQLTTSGSGGGGGGSFVAPLPGSGNTAAAANQSIGIQAYDGTSNMVPLQETGGALKVTGTVTGGGAPLPGNTPTPTSSSGQAVGLAAVVGANLQPLTATGTSLNMNITGGSIANTAFGITGSIPAGTNSIGTVNIAGSLPSGYTPSSGATGALGAIGDIIVSEAANTTTLNNTLSTISTNVAKNTYTSGALQVDCTTGCGGGSGGTVFPFSINQGDNQPINQVEPTTGNNGNAIALMGFDSTGNNVDRLQDTSGALNVFSTGGTVALGAGSNTIGNVSITAGSRGTVSGTPLYFQCTSGCSGGSGGSSTPSTWSLSVTSNAGQSICPPNAGPNANGTGQANVSCTIVSISVGCNSTSQPTCSGALAQSNIGGIYDAGTATNTCVTTTGSCLVYSFGALGGSTGYQTVEPWGPNGYTFNTGGVVAMNTAIPQYVTLYISGHN